jgi:transcriptional regulator with XRE-family HTH domain
VADARLIHFQREAAIGASFPMKAPDHDVALGSLLRDLRVSRDLSVKRLAKLSGVARKTIDNAEHGLNVSVAVLRKLLLALDVVEITFRVDGDHSVRRSGGFSSEVIEGIAADLRAAAARLDALHVDPKPDLDGQAERLIHRFTSLVRNVADPEQLAVLSDSVETLTQPSVPTKQLRSAPSVRKRARPASKLVVDRRAR